MQISEDRARLFDPFRHSNGRSVVTGDQNFSARDPAILIKKFSIVGDLGLVWPLIILIKSRALLESFWRSIATGTQKIYRVCTQKGKYVSALFFQVMVEITQI